MLMNYVLGGSGPLRPNGRSVYGPRYGPGMRDGRTPGDGRAGYEPDFGRGPAGGGRAPDYGFPGGSPGNFGTPRGFRGARPPPGPGRGPGRSPSQSPPTGVRRPSRRPTQGPPVSGAHRRRWGGDSRAGSMYSAGGFSEIDSRASSAEHPRGRSGRSGMSDDDDYY